SLLPDTRILPLRPTQAAQSRSPGTQNDKKEPLRTSGCVPTPEAAPRSCSAQLPRAQRGPGTERRSLALQSRFDSLGREECDSLAESTQLSDIGCRLSAQVIFDQQSSALLQS